MLKFRDLRIGDIVAFKSSWANITGRVYKKEINSYDPRIYLDKIKGKNQTRFDTESPWVEDERFSLVLRQEPQATEEIKAKNKSKVTFTIKKK